jgi:hypothetical protein
MAYKIDKYLDGELKESVTIRNSKLAHVDAYNRLFDARPDPIKYPTYELKIFIDKKLVSFDDAMVYINQKYEDFEQQRSETHKQVWVRFQGVTNAKSNFKQVWVKK